MGVSGNYGKNGSYGGGGKSGSGGFLPQRGDPRTLKSFIKAEVVYDLTFRFAHNYLRRGDRTVDQMIQSARSGKKNLLEGSKAGRTSTEMEIKLTNVVRARLNSRRDP